MAVTVKEIEKVQFDLHLSNYQNVAGILKETLFFSDFVDRVLSESKLEKDSFSII